MNRKILSGLAVTSLLLFTASTTVAGLQNYSQTTFIPHQITTLDKVETPIGTLEFFDGVPIGNTT